MGRARTFELKFKTRIRKTNENIFYGMAEHNWPKDNNNEQEIVFEGHYK